MSGLCINRYRPIMPIVRRRLSADR